MRLFTRHLFPAVIITLLTGLSGCASMGTGTISEKQDAILTMQDTALAQLYREKPDTKAQLANAPGYAVFSNANVNVVFVSAGTGYGVLNNRVTGGKTYMNMAEGGVGLGIGAKDYRIVMVFHTQQAMNYFLEHGWTAGGNADATAKAGKKGVTYTGEGYFGDVTVYTMTESGLALQATVKGTRFWADEQLN